MGKPTSKWVSVNGGVPQGTLSGPELFIHTQSDFKTVATDVKFVDDSNLVDTGNKNKIRQNVESCQSSSKLVRKKIA